MASTLRKTVRGAVLSLAIAATLAPAAQAQEEEFIPGYTDFPNALRIESETSETFVPGHTDFPNHLRVDSAYDPAPASGGGEEVLVVPAQAGGFDWVDAVIGAGGAVGLILVAAGGAVVVLHRRPTRRTALTG